MACSRLATSITWSAGTNRNSGLLSMKRLISHGQAIRSTRAFSRVIHFMSVSFGMRLSAHFVNRRAMSRRQKGVKAVAGRRQGRRMRALLGGHAAQPLHRLRFEHIDQSRIADRDVELPALAGEPHDVGGSAEGPLVQDLS